MKNLNLNKKLISMFKRLDKILLNILSEEYGLTHNFVVNKHLETKNHILIY